MHRAHKHTLNQPQQGAGASYSVSVRVKCAQKPGKKTQLKNAGSKAAAGARAAQQKHKPDYPGFHCRCNTPVAGNGCLMHVCDPKNPYKNAAAARGSRRKCHPAAARDIPHTPCPLELPPARGTPAALWPAVGRPPPCRRAHTRPTHVYRCHRPRNATSSRRMAAKSPPFTSAPVKDPSTGRVRMFFIGVNLTLNVFRTPSLPHFVALPAYFAAF